MEQTATQITDTSLVTEYQEAVTEYAQACERTLQQSKAILHVREQTTELVGNLPKHEDHLERWNPVAAEKVCCQLDLVASAHNEQAERLHAQARALRRVSRSVISIQNEVKKNEGSSPVER